MIIYIRHGQTQWNTQNRYQGQLNSPLTQNGLDQAKCVAVQLKNFLDKEPIELKTYASPLGRALETANIISSHTSLEYEICDSLREVTLGSWDGKTPDEITKEYPHVDLTGKGHTMIFESPDGETIDSVKSRMNKWIDRENENILLVAHGLIGRVLFGEYVNMSEEESLKIDIDQGTFYILENNEIHKVEAGVRKPYL